MAGVGAPALASDEKETPMSPRFRTRPRLAAAAVLTLAGGMLAAGSPPAQAECPRASVWIYHNKEGRHYLWGPEKCLVEDDTWVPVFYDKAYNEPNHDVPPSGTPTGAGAEVWITLPPG